MVAGEDGLNGGEEECEMFNGGLVLRFFKMGEVTTTIEFEITTMTTTTVMC